MHPHDFIKLKRKGRRIAMVTAYEYFQARIADEAGIDGLLVGDSLGMVVLGFRSTHPVTLGMVIHHLKGVVNANPKSLIVADMPFLTYEVDKREAVRNAGELIRHGADAVKVEGGLEIIDKVEAMINAGIPVMGHIGLNPQRALLRGLRLRGRDEDEMKYIFESALELEKAGVFSIIVEFTYSDIARELTRLLSIPVICIGSGPWCDGQILVFHDLVGLNPNPPPFAKRYLDLYQLVADALRSYIDEIEKGAFPSQDHFWSLDEEGVKTLRRIVSGLKRGAQ